MTLQEKSLSTIELPKILELLAAEAATEPARELCRALRPETDLFQCEKLQNETEDASRLIGLQGSPAFSGLKDISGALERAEKGGLLNPVELLAVGALLRAARLTKAYREERREQQETSLDNYFTLLTGNRMLEDRIEMVIVSEEEISDHASSELYQIRRQIRAASSRIRDVLSKIASSNSKALQDSIVTQRNGRFVVPVKAEYRSTFPGMVHDTSSSGATLFIEPAAVVELNNQIRILNGKEKAEIERILAELSADTAQHAGAIRRDYQLLCQLDYIFARGKLGYKMRGVRPRLLESGRTEIIRARHPLLDRDTAVPVTFNIGGGVDTVIITGPNTGGKTVGIKTLGLLTAMAQCGLQIPASDGSQIVIFAHILADIGDEQSIEQSLSTFSSHMRTIVDILAVAGRRTLVLLDELGAGTDPVEGAALARAIIEELRRRGCTVAATTHYAELKVFGLETPGVENASCEFDVQTLRPTYRLIFGVPGKSNAFAISQRLGLDQQIIAAASTLIATEDKRFEDVITRLEEKRQALEGKVAQAEQQKRDAEAANQKARERLSTLEAEREKLIQDAKQKAKEIIDNARAASEMALDEVRRLRQEAADGKDANLAAARAALRGALSDAEKKTDAQRAQRKAIPLPRPLKAGDGVEIVATHTRGVVLETPKPGEKVLVQAGILKIQLKPTELQLLEEEPPKKEEKLRGGGVRLAAPANFSSELDLRGENGDEAVMELERFIDGAVRLHLETIRIIHGKGTGVLRQRVQAFLKRSPQVQSFRLGVYGEGEDGVTVATLRK